MQCHLNIIFFKVSSIPYLGFELNDPNIKSHMLTN